MGTLAKTHSRPTTQYERNGIARVTPKADRGALKLQYAAWLEVFRLWLITGTNNPGSFAGDAGGYVDIELTGYNATVVVT